MAYSIQFPNNVTYAHVNYQDPELRHSTRNSNQVIRWDQNYGDSMYSSYQKITDICPSLCFQADVVLPNARAAVQSATCEVSSDTPGRFVMGCKGNQVQNDFMLEPLIPTAIPIVQYPAFKLGYAIQERDICAVPVLNWEDHIIRVKRAMLMGWGENNANYSAVKKPNHVYNPMEESQVLLRKKIKWNRRFENIPIEERPPVEEISSEDEDKDSSCSDSSDSSDDNRRTNKRVYSARDEIKKKFFKIDEDLSRTAEEKKLLKKQEEIERSIMGKSSNKTKKKRKPPGLATASLLLPKQLRKQYERLSKRRKETEGLVHPEIIKKFKNLPELRVEATWNYFYGGSNGACCSVMKPKKVVDVFVGNRTQLRKIQLKENPSSVVSYSVESVWEEDKTAVPSNIRPGRDEPLSDIVFQIVPAKYHIIGVRRGKSIEIYDNSEQNPFLLDSIPNICYGTRSYEGWTQKSKYDVIKDPLLFGLDFNPQFAPEFITVDENRIVRIGDIYAEKTVSSYKLDRIPRPWPKFAEWPKYQPLNNGSGVCFCQNGHTFLTWVDSKVILGDRRDLSYARSTLTEIFDARRSRSTLSWSDQKFFNEAKMELNDYISAVVLSKRDYYYYVGTTSRVMLMDMRVPGQPVLKSSHGMKAAASQLDTYSDENFEVLVAASQRVPSTFCMLTDYAHVACASRPNCEAKNPVLPCLPRHLSSSEEFFDTVVKSGITCASEADHQRCGAQSHAWTTGLSVLKSSVRNNPRLPPGVIVLTSNCYGDVYYQELLQKPCEGSCTPLKTNDEKFVQFLKKWRNSMTSSSLLEYAKPSLNLNDPADNSLIVEISARNIKKIPAIRDKPFNAFTPDELIHRHATLHHLDICQQLDQLRVTSAETKKFFDVWTEDGTTEMIEPVNIKEEIVEGDGNFWNDEDNDYDIQVLSATTGQAPDAVHVNSPTSSDSDSEDIVNNFMQSTNMQNAEEGEQEQQSSQVNMSQGENRSEFVEDIDYFADEETYSPAEILNVELKPGSFLEASEPKHESILQTDNEDVARPPPVNPAVEVKLNLEEQDDDQNIDFESMLLSRFPQGEEDELFSGVSGYSQHFAQRQRYEEDDPLSLGFEDELNFDSPSSQPYASLSQTSTSTRNRGSSKKAKRFGF